MPKTIAIRREDETKVGELRVGITPKTVSELVSKGYEFLVQPRLSPINGEVKRIFEDAEYEKAGAKISEDISKAEVIFGLKEISIEKILPNKTYLFFSHTHKGQVKNREMLKDLVKKKSTVIDYELITNSHGRRTVTSFTTFAGYAGIIDTLWTYGKRLETLGLENPFSKISQTITHSNLEFSKNQIKEVGKFITANGTPKELPPVICAFAGNGGVSKGAQEVFDFLKPERIHLKEIKSVYKNGSRNKVYKIVLGISDLYKTKDGSEIPHDNFYSVYKRHPERFETRVPDYIDFISIWVNGINWTPKFPRLLTYEDLKNFFTTSKKTNLKTIGDITCDPEGSIQCSRETWIDDPVFIFNPKNQAIDYGFEGEGLSVMAVTNLPCELPKDASELFSQQLTPYLEQIFDADFSKSFNELDMKDEVKKAMFLQNGSFTEKFKYMSEYL
ncbi:MAG: hypothetical protein DWQ06_10065 [Calditrichaeota bacterium]|nr:MAG: hypothetical protein DWQ06_10065 [Calditrichota bacterium]